MTEPEILRLIRQELKRAIRLLIMQLQTERGGEHVFTILIEVSVTGTYVIRVAGTEESLTRLAETYIAKGYRAKSGDLLQELRAMLRWDAPGDDLAGWYWGNQDDDKETVRLVDQAMQSGLFAEYDENQTLRKLSVEALRELDQEGVFGIGSERERVLIGICCCESGFEFDEEFATLNPGATIERFRRELQAATNAENVLIRPSYK